MSSTAQPRPETYRLPKPGANDPFFGITRGGYYAGEKLGYWKLIRVLHPGKTRGTTLIPFDEVAAFISKQRKQQANKSENSLGSPGSLGTL